MPEADAEFTFPLQSCLCASNALGEPTTYCTYVSPLNSVRKKHKSGRDPIIITLSSLTFPSPLSRMVFCLQAGFCGAPDNYIQ